MKTLAKNRGKSILKKMAVAVLAVLVFLTVSAPLQAYAIEIDTTDGSTDDWDDKAGTYTYNWDNSANCWQYGVWVDGVCYTTPEGEYSTDVRHYVQTYKGDEGIAVHIVFSRDYTSGINGESYDFNFADGSAKFQITDADGTTLTNNVNNMEPGVYTIQIKHGAGAVSGTLVEGATATLYIPEDGVNPEVEFQIPYDAFTTQNSAVDADSMSSVDFFSPNLMYEKVYIEGAPTGNMFSMLMGLGLAGLYFVTKSGKLDSFKNRKTKV